MLIKDIMSVFRQGRALENPETWHNRAMLVNALSAFLLAAGAIAKTMGWIQIDISSDDAQNIALGVATLWTLGNGMLHVATNKDIGLPSATSEPVPDKSPILPPDQLPSKPEASVKASQRDDTYSGGN